MGGERLSASDVLSVVVDAGSFVEWDRDVARWEAREFGDNPAYRQRWLRAVEETGRDESALTGVAAVQGQRIALIVGEFGFMAGTMGVASAERVIRCFERATAERLPLLAITASGGTRMQEGVLAFVQMAAIAAAVRRFRDSGSLYLTYLRDPTTGGVLASYGALGHLVFAEPDALLALTGPKVRAQVQKEQPRAGGQVGTALGEPAGFADGVFGLGHLRQQVARLLRATQEAPAHVDFGPVPRSLPEDAHVDGWVAVDRSRQADRPGVRELLDVCAADLTPLSDDGAGQDDPGCTAAVGRICGIGAVLVANDRPRGQRGASLGPVGYRKARRAMGLAEDLDLPFVAIIDGTGARSADASEDRILAVEIARCLSDLSALRVPTMSLLLGEGSGGGAIALLPTDRVIAVEHSWLAPIAPEGASSILYRTIDRAPEMARSQGISSTELRDRGIVDLVIPDQPSGPGESESFSRRVAAVMARELRVLLDQRDRARLDARQNRWRRPGRPEAGNRLGLLDDSVEGAPPDGRPCAP